MLHEKLQKQVPAWALLAVAVGTVLLFTVGSGLYNSGWSDGLSMGLLASGGDGAKLLTYQGDALHHGWRIGGFFGGILHLFFFFFVMSMIFRVLGFMRWKMHMAHGGAEQGADAKNFNQRPWGGPPWMRQHAQWQQSQPQQPQSQQTQPQQSQQPTDVPVSASEEQTQNTSWIV